MNDSPTTKYVVSETGSGRKVRQLREAPEFLPEPMHSLCRQAEKENAPPPEHALGSDKKHSMLDAQVVDSTDIMSSKAAAASAGAEFFFNPAQHRPDAGPHNIRPSHRADVLLQFPQNFQVVGRKPNRGSDDALLPHANHSLAGDPPTEQISGAASFEYRSNARTQPDFEATDEIRELLVTVPISDIFPGLQTFEFVDGEFKPSALALPSLEGAWKYLSEQESSEENLHLVDDLRISKLCLLQVEAGNPDPWRFAFWTYMGIVYEKWVGIYAEREAYQKTLGPTLTEQLKDPLFLATLDPLVRSAFFVAEPQRRIPFSPQSVPSPKKEGVA